MDFDGEQRAVQLAYFAARLPAERRGGGVLRGKSYDIALLDPADNLYPAIRDMMRDYMQTHSATWHDMRAHMLSSQVCCMNFLAPFAAQPRALAQLMAPLFGAEVEILPIEGEDGCVAFEFVGGDYLNESVGGRRTRGANCTSADAAIRLRTNSGIEFVLIEWKYTESYGAPLDPKGNETRKQRYDALFRDGPLRTDPGLAMEAFFYEPFYQLMRQQMLAPRDGARTRAGR